MDGGTLAIVIGSTFTSLGTLITGTVIIIKKIVPWLLQKADERTDSTLEFFKEELREERADNKLEREQFVKAVNGQTEAVNKIAEVASNHLTEFTREICEKLDCIVDKLVEIGGKNA